MIATPKLLCSECQHENEQERVYCHNCGARLDRAAVLPTKEPVRDTHKRVKKMFDPHRAKMRALFFKTSKAILGAGALAVTVQVLLPPDLRAPAKTLVLVSSIRSELESATAHNRPPQIDLNEEEVNAYVFSALRSKKSALDKPLLEFKRAVVGLPEGAVAVTVERSFFGYSFFTSGTYSVATHDGKLVAAPKAGLLGRMPIHPVLMQYANVAFADVWKALDLEARLLGKFGAVQVHDKHVLLRVAAQ